MFDQNNHHENQLNKIDAKIIELEIRLEAQNREIENFFNEFQIKPEVIQKFLKDPAGLSPENREELEKQNKEFHEHMETLTSVADPRKTLKARKSLAQKSQHWIYVR